MGEQPDAAALVGNGPPVVQGNDLVQLSKTRAGIAGGLADAEGVAVRRDLDGLRIVQHVHRRAAPVAGEDEAHALRVPHIGLYRGGAHHDDIRIAQIAGDIFRHVKAVAGARVTEDHILTHGYPLLCF